MSDFLFALCVILGHFRPTVRCFQGETCGVVKSEDEDGDDKKMCYNKNGQSWPMECKVDEMATLLPFDYKSPRTPLEGGAIAGEYAGQGPPYLNLRRCPYYGGQGLVRK